MRKIESSPHQKLYVEYGFSLPENPEDSVPIELADMAGDNVDAARESGLTENMSISALGPTWNLGWNSSLKFLCYLSMILHTIQYFWVSFSPITTVQQFPSKLACAYILSLKLEQHWKNVYDLDLENDAKAMSATRKVMEKIRNQILNSLKDLGSMHELTESAEAAVNLMRTHLDLLEKARS